MPPIDRPDLTRRLAGVDHALADGSARRPGDLLDQLRERLDRLDPSHPSATRQAEQGELVGRGELAGRGEVAEPGGVAESGEVAEPDAQDSQRDGGAQAHRESDHQHRAGRVDPRDSRVGPRGMDGERSGPGSDEPVTSPADASAADSEFRAIDEIGAIDVARLDTRERYRPWFAADEPGTPWFIE